MLKIRKQSIMIWRYGISNDTMAFNSSIASFKEPGLLPIYEN